MRWSRHHTDSSLGELMDSQPDTSDVTPTDGVGTDDDTHVRLWPGDYTGDPGSSGTPSGAGDDADAEAPSPDTGSLLDDEDYLPQERHGPGRLTVALVAALVLAVGVLGGVWVQKQLGSAQGFSAAGGQGTRSGAAGGQGMPGGAAGGQGMPGGAASGAAGGAGMPGGGASGAPDGSSAEGAGTQGTGTQPATPAVVGTVSSAGNKTLVVTDLGGSKHTVTVTSTTTVTTPYGHGALEKGDTVSVSGSTASDGSVTATGLTVS